MSPVVFAGPTIAAGEIRAIGAFEVRPPAAMGDVACAVREGHRRIGVIDGYFGGAASVWHKEILWAIRQGVQVFGAASMGALRAAELHRFGMRGCGEVFEAFRDGRLEDDDEVALVHGPGALGYPPLSVPMVNIRASLAGAGASGVLDADEARCLADALKATFYPERSWAGVLDAAERLLSPRVRDALGAWLDGGRIDQKKRDAVAMLRAMLAEADRPAPEFAFEWSVMWDKAHAWCVARDAAREAERDAAAGVLDELRLEPVAYRRLERLALARHLATAPARGAVPDDASLSRALGALRAARGLGSRRALDDWLSRNDLGEAGLRRLLTGEVAVEARARDAGRALDGAMLDERRLSGAYPRLAGRAGAKREALEAARRAGGGRLPPLPPRSILRGWFSESVLSERPDEDAAALHVRLGLPDAEACDALIAAEFLFRRLEGGGAAPDEER
ncbi:MAG: TfuA-like protein [Paracoccaceae bacterium]